MKILIIGAGAAGMMAAITAARAGAEVSVYEQNEKPGKKLFITGKGRCNLTNASDSANHLSSVVSHSKFLYSAENGFDAYQTMEFFEQLGVDLKTERGARVFPKSDHSSDVIRALEYECKRLGVKIFLNTKVSGLLTEPLEQGKDEEQTEKKKKKEKRRTARIVGIRLSGGKNVMADKVILASGGVSYPATGADDSGLRMAKACGHTITDLYPALVPFVCKQAWVRELAGLSLRNIAITIKDGKKVLYEEFGEMLFTHRGVSGPVILSASSFVSAKLAEKELTLLIDLKPALDEETLDRRLIRELEDGGTKQIKNVMRTLLPHSLIDSVLQMAGVDGDLPASQIDKKRRNAIRDTLKGFCMTVTGTEGFEQAIVTRGGIATNEIDPSTMESKLIQGLYVAGECIDVDALTGGFNLQIAWSCGYKAGMCAAMR
ncbi:MAG: NAD(P)/FAD-dependent oxidoreductase [Lachnospiraceae bacterium]|nr:NAD(P)/FAD-dependent oxidoreductase [Lachnospiraceae bacterium]